VLSRTVLDVLATQNCVRPRLIAFDHDKGMFSYSLTAGKPIDMQD